MEPLRVHTVVLSVQHIPEITLEDIRRNLMEKVVKVVIPAKFLDEKTIYHLLPSGKFLLGGPQVIKRKRRKKKRKKIKKQETCDDSVSSE